MSGARKNSTMSDPVSIRTAEWSLPGADGETVYCSTDHRDDGDTPLLAILIAHGFKGYKDYGFIPVLSRALAADPPVVVHRFNFSHSGMTNDTATFARPDLFERDTWNKQVADLDALIDRVSSGEAPATPAGTPFALAGHSRGGVSCLLCAGRRARDNAAPTPVAVVTLAAPDRCCSMSDDAKTSLRKSGFIDSPSSRTGQSLRVGRIRLDEQDADPDGHDLEALCAMITCPVLAVHGEQDPTVPATSATTIARSCRRGENYLIAGADHVFNTPNPADIAAPMSAPLAEAFNRILKLFRQVSPGG